MSRLVTSQRPLDPQSFLTSSKHIRSKQTTNPSVSRRSSPLLPKRDEFRNVTVSSLSKTPSPAPIQLAPNQPKQQSPARTPPPTSLFLPMQLSNSGRGRSPGTRRRHLRRMRRTDFRRAQSRPTWPRRNVRTAPPPPLSREETFKVQPEIRMAIGRSTRQRRRCALI